MSKAIVYTALVVVCLGVGALIAGLAVHFTYKDCSMNDESFAADCILMTHTGNDQIVSGRLRLTMSTSADLEVVGNITGLSLGLHGFHIHQYGVQAVVNGKANCGSTSGHYNPHEKNHGSPSDDERHVGDLGNINVTTTTDFKLRVDDTMASLFGEYSILGRAVVIHAGADDFVTENTGGAGPRLACCTIMHSP